MAYAAQLNYRFMPEGPEIKREAEKIAAVLQNQICNVVEFGQSHLTTFNTVLRNVKVNSVKPRGKAMLIEFNNGMTIYSHNQLYGKWVVLKLGEVFDTQRQLRILLRTQIGEARLYSASDIEVLSTQAIQKHAFIRKLGPDVLDDSVSQEEMLQWVSDMRWHKKKLGSLLLDQGFLAGLGNYLRSEILFACRLHHDTKLSELSTHQVKALVRKIRTIAMRSYETGGLCLSEKQTMALKRINNDYEFYRFAVFGHDGRACIRCKTEINKTNVASRRIYYCSNCQKE